MKQFKPGQDVWVIVGNEVVQGTYYDTFVEDSSGQHIVENVKGFPHDENIFGAPSEALQELANRQLRAYAETLRKLATVDPDAVHGKLIGPHCIQYYGGSWWWDSNRFAVALECVDYAIRKTFGEGK